MGTGISPQQLQVLLNSEHPPLVVDVRRREAYLADKSMLAGALRRDPERVAQWAAEFPRASIVVAYCEHGQEISQGVAEVLERAGISARFLEGGFVAWQAAGGDLSAKPTGASTRWVTRERPKVDRIACPWLISRFVDAQAQFLYVPAAQVLLAADRDNATPYDIPDVAFSHVGERCSFDAFLKAYRLRHPALDKLALIVRGADTARLELAPQAAGLLAISLGLSHCFPDDHEMLGHGMLIYDALYQWCKHGEHESPEWNTWITWNPPAYR